MFTAIYSLNMLAISSNKTIDIGDGQLNSDHQNHYMSRCGNPYNKPSFATGILGGGHTQLGGGFKYVSFSPLFGEDFQFD